MKILFVQLARLGDIYLTWPTIHAAIRNYPEAEIHLLVRERFLGATVGLPENVKIHILPTAKLLEPLLNESINTEKSIERLNQFLDGIVSEEFDRVINLSFSPFSSYLLHYFQSYNCQIAGYSRHSDGYFNAPDDLSAYFYAQVGIDRWNRYHLTEIFASLAGVDLVKDDWSIYGRLPFFERVLPSKYIVVHLGASQKNKAWPNHLWSEFLEKLAKSQTINVVLVGSQGEDAGVEKIAQKYPQSIVNLVGRTRVSDLLFITQWADLCIGGDSVTMHAASLTGTTCLNISSQSVNFWETGPVSHGSEIIWSHSLTDISADQLFESCTRMLDGKIGSTENIKVFSLESPVKYDWKNSEGSDFEWHLIQALYTGRDFPILEDPVAFQAIYRVRELSELALSQMESLSSGSNSEFSKIMQNIDDTITQVGHLNSVSGVIVRWFETEKLRVPPQEVSTLVEQTFKIYSDLNKICRVFVGDETYKFEQGEINAD